MAYYGLMGDVHFSCPACTQPLVVEEAAAGLTIDCPHCARALQIPHRTRDEKELQASRKLSKWINRATDLERELYDAQTQLAAARRESEQRQEALAETLHQLQSTKETVELLQMEEADLRVSCETVTGQLRQSQAVALQAQRRVSDLAADHELMDEHVQQIEIELAHKKEQLEAAHLERNQLLQECAQKNESLAEMGAELDTVRGQFNETAMIANRTKHELARAQTQLAEGQSENEKLSSELSEAGSAARHLQATLKLAQQERDQLAEAIKQDHELADFLALKEARSRLEIEFREMQAAFAETREKLANAAGERDELRKESVELQLKISALRDSASDAELISDNKTLRGIIERLNEEMKDRPAPRRRRGRREKASRRRFGDLARALWARCFVSDPDVI